MAEKERTMPQFMLLLYGDPSRWETMSPDEMQVAFGKYMGWGKKARDAGFLTGLNKLKDDGGKVVQSKNGVATDGPYSETKEVLGGYYIIEAANYDEAVRRTLDHPHLEYDGVIAVREVEQLPG